MSTSSPNPRSPGSHPISTDRKKRPWWLLVVLAIAAIIVLLLVLSQCGGDDSPSKTAAADDSSRATADSSATAGDDATPTGSSDTTSPSGELTVPVSPPAPSDSLSASTSTSSDAPSVSASDTAGPGATGGGSLTAGSTTLLPASAATPTGDLIALAKQPVTAQGVKVLSVPADEGFWVGSSTTDRIWVQLSDSGESSYQVKAGDLINFTGTVLPHGAGFAARVGVSSTEGARQLTTQKAHIMADRTTVQLSAN